MSLGALKQFDAYSRRARLAPAFLVALPVAVSALVLTPMLGGVAAGLWSIATACGLTFVLASLVRDTGKRCEARLLNLWNGFPTRRYLRHSDQTLNPHTKKRYREALASLTPDVPLPGIEAEQLDANAADAAYDAHIDTLRAATRRESDFPLLAEENREYGFRRNTRGIRTTGIVTSGAATAVLLAHGYNVWSVTGVIPVPTVAIGVAAGLLLIWWFFVVSDAWVAAAAHTYALRLLETSGEAASRRLTKPLVMHPDRA